MKKIFCQLRKNMLFLILLWFNYPFLTGEPVILPSDKPVLSTATSTPLPENMTQEETNQPIANAGEDQFIFTVENEENLTGVMIDGRSSFDPLGNALSYVWSENGVPIAWEESFEIKISPGIHKIDLVVNNGTLFSDPDSVIITVVPPLVVSSILTGQTIIWGKHEDKIKVEFHLPFPDYVKEDVDSSFLGCLITSNCEIQSLDLPKVTSDS